MLWISCILFCSVVISNHVFDGCNSPFYCQGFILDQVQRLKIFKDSKHFVDMASSKPENIVKVNLQRLLKSNIENRDVVKKFIQSNFHEPGIEIDFANLTEFTTDPAFLKDINDPSLRYFAKDIIKVWPTLYRTVDKSLICNGCASSLLDLKYPFIIPGGRFREYYYFDTFFIMEGLLLSDLVETTKLMIINFLDLVNKYGFVPNGSRIYLMSRSQPPFLTQMVDIYLKRTNDYKFLLEHIDTLDKEYDYWISTHSIKVPCRSLETCYLARYHSSSQSPRPESYLEDINIVENTNKTPLQKQRIYSSITAATESGWDFSVRWTHLRINATVEDSSELLKTVETEDIVPVDLNSVIYRNEVLLSKFHKKASKLSTNNSAYHNRLSKKYLENSQKRAKIMQELLWDKESGLFYDYSLLDNKLIKFFNTAIFMPFWANALTPEFKKDVTNFIKPFKYLNEKLDMYKFGIPATEIQSGLQWDYPNVWAPLVYLSTLSAVRASKNIDDIVKNNKNISERNSNNFKVAEEVAIKSANIFIKTAYCSWINSGGTPYYLKAKNNIRNITEGYFYEKYNTEKLGGVGGGGEYSIQTGFGWTNGVLLYFINKFKSSLKLPDLSECK